MKVLIYTLGTRGDVQPYVALAAELKARGHSVVVSTGQGFDALIEAKGVQSRALSIDFRRLLQTPEVRAALRSVSGKLRTFKLLRQQTIQQFDEMWAIGQAERPDLIVVSPKAYAGILIARALRVPCVSTTLQPNFTPTGEFPVFLVPVPTLGALGNRASYRAFNWLSLAGQNTLTGDWAARTLPLTAAAARLDGFSGGYPDGRSTPLLHAYSSALVPRPADWHASQHITGYWFDAPSSDWLPPKSLSDFLANGAPPVYVGFGSMPTADHPGLTQLITETLRDMKLRAVVALGWSGSNTDEPAAEHVYKLEAAPHAYLFPHCAAVVHHGGAGTTHEGLRWGRPSVLFPIGLDQPFWGRVVARLGVGPKPIALDKLTRDGLTAALKQALRPEMAARAAHVADAMRGEGGTARAADVLDGLSHAT